VYTDGKMLLPSSGKRPLVRQSENAIAPPDHSDTEGIQLAACSKRVYAISTILQEGRMKNARLRERIIAIGLPIFWVEGGVHWLETKVFPPIRPRSSNSFTKIRKSAHLN